MNNDTFCILPFIHLEARSDSKIALCCMSQEFLKKDDGSLFTLTADTLSDAWESNHLHGIRESLTSGIKHSACTSCWKEEVQGFNSKRKRENKRWGTEYDGNIKFLDLKLGNTCNLKCRICNPVSSSLWVKEWTEVNNGHNLLTIISESISPDTSERMVMQWPEYNDQFWIDLEGLLGSIKMFEIYGGEPFLIKRHFELLRLSVAKGYSKNQEIHYNTNGTIYPTTAIDSIWPYFKSVTIMVSIDGIDDQFEYQRHPAKWKVVEENLFKLIDKLGRDSVKVCLTVSAFNVFYIPEYIKYFSLHNITVWLNVLYHPSNVSMKVLPMHAKEVISEKLKVLIDHPTLSEPITPIINYLMSDGGNELLYNQFLKTVQQHDNFRQESFKDTFPEYWALLANESPLSIP